MLSRHQHDTVSTALPNPLCRCKWHRTKDIHHAADDQMINSVVISTTYYYHCTTDHIIDIWIHSLLKEERSLVNIRSVTVITEL